MKNKAKLVINIIVVALAIILFAGHINSVRNENALRFFQNDAKRLSRNIIEAEIIDREYDVHIVNYSEGAIAIWLEVEDKVSLSEDDLNTIYSAIEDEFKAYEFRDDSYKKARIFIHDLNNNSNNEENSEIKIIEK